MDALERLLEDRPALHGWPDGRTADWSMSLAALRHLHSLLQPGMSTLETGAGVSTIVFALRGTRHVCITPDHQEVVRIRSYCKSNLVEQDITFIIEPSDRALAWKCPIPEQLDLVLIDGAHRFPYPIIDWHFTEARVPQGGFVVIDDIQLASVRILHDFLDGEDEWALARTVGTTAFFRRVRPTVPVDDWRAQKINRSRTAKEPANLLTRLRAALASFRSQAMPHDPGGG